MPSLKHYVIVAKKTGKNLRRVCEAQAHQWQRQCYMHYGLEEIKLRESAREQAITAAILQFVPVEQHDAVIELMETATREYYESIGLGEAYRSR